MDADGVLISLGVRYAPPAGQQRAAPHLHSAAHGAISLAYLLQFYQKDVIPLEEARPGQVVSTDTIVKRVIMRKTWEGSEQESPDSGQVLRYTELLEPKHLWPGPGSGRDM